MSGDRIAAKVRRGIEKAGRKTGNGTPLTGTIIRAAEVAGDGIPEELGGGGEGAPAEYTCTLILSDCSARDRDGTNITERDVKAMIAADAETDPRNGDSLRVAGKTYSVINVDPNQPGGTVLYWKCQVRSGDS